jgi:hypothetical protein
VGVPFARLRHDIRWHRSMVPSNVCMPWCFDEVFLECPQHGSSTCPLSSASAPLMSSLSWSRADAGHLQPALEPPPPLFMTPSWTWTLQGSRRTHNIASVFIELCYVLQLSSSSPHAAFLNIVTARFRLDLHNASIFMELCHVCKLSYIDHTIFQKYNGLSTN